MDQRRTHQRRHRERAFSRTHTRLDRQQRQYRVQNASDPGLLKRSAARNLRGGGESPRFSLERMGGSVPDSTTESLSDLRGSPRASGSPYTVRGRALSFPGRLNWRSWLESVISREQAELCASRPGGNGQETSG